MQRKHRLYYGYILVAIGLLIMTIAWGTMFSIGVFFKPMLEDLQLSRAATSIAQSISILFTGIGSIVMGKLNDRFGPRLVVTAGGIILGAGYLLMSTTQSTWQLYLFRGVMVGIGMSGIYVPLVATVSRWFQRRIGLMAGIIMSGMGLGTTLIPLLTNWLIMSYDWRNSYLILGGGVFVIIVLAAQILRREPNDIGGVNVIAAEEKQSATELPPRKIMRTVQFWQLGAIFLMLNFCADVVLVHIVPYATDLTISPLTAASFLAVIGMVSIPARIIMGNVADKTGSKLSMIICFSGLLASFIWLLSAQSEWAFYLFAAAFGFFYGGVVALPSLAVAELFGIKYLGFILGVVTFGATIGAAGGPTSAGYIFDISGSYQPAFIICAAFSALCLLLALLLRPVAQK